MLTSARFVQRVGRRLALVAVIASSPSPSLDAAAHIDNASLQHDTTLGTERPIKGPPPPVAPEVINRDPQGRATIRAVRLKEVLTIDGRLDEQTYRDVMAISDFVQGLPDNGQPATQRTDVWVLFDDRHIYVSARCWDTEPESTWVANEMRRDKVSLNDNFGVMFDSYYDRRTSHMFYVNPLGAFTDAENTSETTANFDYNPVWKVRTGRFEGGWTVEMEFPLKSLRYRPGPSQVWGIQFRRSIRRRNEVSFVTLLPVSQGTMGLLRASAAPTLVGLETPPVGRNLEVKPYLTGGATSDRAAVPPTSNDLKGNIGFDIKYGVTPNVTVDVTYNTDVAQVEVDEQQINLTRYSQLFPEKRDFFLESRGLFEFAPAGSGPGTANTPQLFFSRRIGLNGGRVVPIVAGARLAGRAGPFAIGALNIQTGKEIVSRSEATNFSVLRLRRDLLRRSSIGFMVTNRSSSAIVPGASNQAFGGDTSFAFYDNVSFAGYYANTRTPGVTGKTDSYQGRFDYAGDRYGFAAEHLFIGDRFNPEIGFVRRSDLRRTFLSGRFSPRPVSSKTVRQFGWTADLDYVLNAAGQLESRDQVVGFESEFRSSDRFTLSATRSYDALVRPFAVTPEVTIDAGGYQFSTVRTAYALGAQRRLAGTFSVEHGGFYRGHQTAVTYNQGRLQLSRHLSLEPTFSISKIDLPHASFVSQIYRTRVVYAFTPSMYVTGLVQHNSSSHTLSGNFRFRWEYNPGSEFFVVYTEDARTNIAGRFSDMLSRAIVVKINRLLRF